MPWPHATPSASEICPRGTPTKGNTLRYAASLDWSAPTQQQRLARARAIVREPRLLLLDEPLSNLDAKLREHMRAELRELQRRLGLTTIYVTHDQIEALGMSNRIALMSAGRIVQEGPPRELYQRPATQFVASFLGSTNLLEAEVLGRVEGLWILQTPVGQILAACVQLPPECCTVISDKHGVAAPEYRQEVSADGFLLRAAPHR